MGEDNMSHEYLSDQTHRAPNGKFYSLWQGCAVCTVYGSLRYFETAQDARTFFAECGDETRLGEFAIVPGNSATSRATASRGEPLWADTDGRDHREPSFGRGRRLGTSRSSSPRPRPP